jgi:ABC-type uncharacterized transport system ATPase component
MELKQGQARGLEESLEILETERLVVRGSAGTGKTSMVDALIDAAIIKFGIRGTIVCSAPTHKALAILSGKIHNKSSFSTIHSVLKYQKRHRLTEMSLCSFFSLSILQCKVLVYY